MRAALIVGVLSLSACGDMSGAGEVGFNVQNPTCVMFCVTIYTRGDWADNRLMAKEVQNVLEDELRRRLRRTASDNAR